MEEELKAAVEAAMVGNDALMEEYVLEERYQRMLKELVSEFSPPLSAGCKFVVVDE